MHIALAVDLCTLTFSTSPAHIGTRGAPPTTDLKEEEDWKKMALAEVRAISKVVALVTGAASGLGRATATRLARQASVAGNQEVIELVFYLTRRELQ